MRIQYLLCVSLLLCGCTKLSDITDQKTKSAKKGAVLKKKKKKKKKSE